MSPKFIVRNEHAEVTFKGRLGEDAKYNAEHDVTNLRLAVSRSWPSEDQDAVNGYKSVTAWFKVAVWKNGAQAIANLGAGDVVEVSCHMADLMAESFTRNSGEPGSGLKIARCRVSLIWSKSGSVDSVEHEATMEAEPQAEMAL